MVGKADRERAGQQASEGRIEGQRVGGGPFVAAVEATRMPMVVTDPQIEGNPIIYANPAFLELCGYPAEEVLGHTIMFLAGSGTDPDTAGRIQAAMSARRTLTEDVRIYRKDGTALWVAAFASPVMEGGRVVQHFASFLDITRRVEAEEALREAKEDLERQVRERTRSLEAEVARRAQVEAELRETVARREEDVRYRTALAREVDHRAKNALQMAAAMLQVQAARSGDGGVRAALGAAQERLARMAEVHALLYQGSEPGSVDFTAYLRRLVADLSKALAPASGRVSVRVDADQVTWAADLVVPLALVVSEALTNALKHAFPGDRQGHVLVSLRVSGGMARLAVEDDGVGLPLTRRQGALGMDLVHTLAAQVGGELTIGPADTASGTTVAVTFPEHRGT